MMQSWDDTYEMAGYRKVAPAFAKFVITTSLVAEHVEEAFNSEDCVFNIQIHSFYCSNISKHFRQVEAKLRLILPESLMDHINIDIAETAQSISPPECTKGNSTSSRNY